jgi:hypothetical protein
VAIQIDKAEAEEILRFEAAKADDGPVSSKWEKLVSKLSELCKSDNRTHIAFLGTAMLAKAANLNADVFAVKAGANTKGAYSARSLGHGVLVPLAPELGINLGVTGREPLNNQPYFRPLRVSKEMVVHGSAVAALDMLLDILAELAKVTSPAEARRALRSFIRVRRTYVPKYKQLGKPIDELLITGLVEKIATFVAQDSEGGKRAQAVVAGLLDLYAGTDRVSVDKINDPDRHMPGDVGVRREFGTKWERVFEVRDKPVAVSDLYHFAQKAASAGMIPKAAIVAVNAGQEPLEVSAVRDWAAARGVELAFISGWESFATQVVFWTTTRSISNLVTATEYIYRRLIQLEASPEAIELWID